MNELMILNQRITECRLCPRLVEHRETVALVKRRAYRDSSYWGRPVTGWGDPLGRLLLVGLAPGAHGANRTGRMFTGDSSGDFLYRALFEAGFASQPQSVGVDDGLLLKDAYISAAVRCAPPDNKPAPVEIRTCRTYLETELRILTRVRVVMALGRLGFESYLAILAGQGSIARRSQFAFGHGATHRLGTGLPILIASYHPSQQNTSTGRLTEGMMREVLDQVRTLIEGAGDGSENTGA